MHYTQRMSAQPTQQIPVDRQLEETPIGHHVMPLWRRTKGRFATFNGVDPNPFFDIFVNLNRAPIARDTLIFVVVAIELRFATLSFASLPTLWDALHKSHARACGSVPEITRARRGAGVRDSRARSS